MMEYVYPDYYPKFSCIAGRCEDTCCAGWQIMIDKESLKKYQRVTGSFGNRLKNCIRWEDGCFDQYDRRCAFLNDDHLCDIYRELGKQSLCQTCRTYPRHIEEFENIREVSLSLSCPEVCRLILGQKQKLSFYYKEDNKMEEIEDFDFFFFTKLEEMRDFLFHLLQMESINIHERLAIALAFAHDAQRRIQKNKIFELDDLIERYQTPLAISDLKKKIERYHVSYCEFIEWMHRLKDIFETLEPLQKQWFKRLDRSLEVISKMNEKQYMKCYSQFCAQYQDLQHDMEQIAVTLIYTYLCGAVYDYDVLSKIKFVFISCMMIEMLDFAQWLMRDHCFTKEDQVWITHCYSREIEHSDRNLNQLEKELKTKSLFHINQLLCMLSMQKNI